MIAVSPSRVAVAITPCSRPIRREHLAALTGLRFVLAAWVMLVHVTGPGQMLDAWARSLPASFAAVVHGGYLAVTTFFVLSGFVLTRTYVNTAWNRTALWQYGKSRFARVYPVYVVSLLMIAPFMLLDVQPGKGKHVLAYVLLLQGWFRHLPVGWNTPAWSLSCEIFFYCAFPLAVLLARRVNWIKTLTLAAAACCLTAIVRSCGVPDAIKPLIHFSDFLMGIAASCAYDLLIEGRQRIRGWWLYLPGAGIGLLAIAFPNALPLGVDLTTALRPLNAMLLVGLALGGGFAARVMASPATVYLGKSSYAMYILHVPVLWYWPGTTAIAGVLYISAVIAISVLVYRFIEEPVNRRLRGPWLRLRYRRR